MTVNLDSILCRSYDPLSRFNSHLRLLSHFGYLTSNEDKQDHSTLKLHASHREEQQQADMAEHVAASILFFEVSLNYFHGALHSTCVDRMTY